MTGGLLNLISYGNSNIIVNGNPKKNFFKATYKKHTNFGLQKNIIPCNATNKRLRENNTSTFDFNIPRWGDLIIDTYFRIKMPYIWSPVFVEPSDSSKTIGLYNINDISNTAYKFPRRKNYAHIPYVEGFEFKWIENLGCQLMKNVTLSIGGLIIQQFTGDYLMNMVDRDFSYEKKELFNEMTGNIKEMYDPAYSGKRKGLYPNSLFGAPLIKRNNTTNKIQYQIYDISNSNYELPANLNPSIFKRILCIPFNFYYMFSSTQALPLISMVYNELKISVECRAIRELFKVRDIRSWVNTYYGVNRYNGDNTKVGVPTSYRFNNNNSIYKELVKSDEIYKDDDHDSFYSLKNIFIAESRAPYISTINTLDPLYQMYMFTTQYAAQNQDYVRKAILKNKKIIKVQKDLQEQSTWDANPELVCTYVYLDETERQVFKERPQSYLITQMQEYLFEKKNHKEYTIDRFKSNSIVKNWMWYLIRTDVKLRNDWSNYTNWINYSSYPYTLQPMYHTELLMDWQRENSYPVWETITHNTANPNIDNSLLPKFGQYITNTTEPANYRVNNYIKDINSNFINMNDESNDIKDIGLMNVSCDIDKMPPYFPYSYKKTDLSFNSSLNYQNGINPYITGPLRKANKKIILKKWGLIFDGKLREDKLESEYYNLVEPFLRSSGNINEGVYSYNFGLNSSPFILDPQGGMNLIKYKHIEFEYNTINLDILKTEIVPVCREVSDNNKELIGYNRMESSIYEYEFNLKIMEEQYNYLTISNGLVSLKYNSSI